MRQGLSPGHSSTKWICTIFFSILFHAQIYYARTSLDIVSDFTHAGVKRVPLRGAPCQEKPCLFRHCPEGAGNSKTPQPDKFSELLIFRQIKTVNSSPSPDALLTRTPSQQFLANVVQERIYLCTSADGNAFFSNIYFCFN